MTTRDSSPDGEASRSRISRWRGLLGLAVTIVRTQTATASGRTLATICVVALTVANLLLVTGVALALADDRPGHDADLRIVPGEGDVHASIAGVEGPRLGESHDRAATIAERDGVTHATPVLAEPLQVDHPGAERSRYLLLVGIVPGQEPATVAGLPTDGLEPAPADGDPAGEIVLSSAAADALEADAEDELALESEVDDREGSWTVTAVEDRTSDGDDDGPPVALVHFHDLQAMTGADAGGLADEVLVWGDADAARAGAADVYPNARLEADSSTDVRALFGDGLALATSALALVVALSICSLLVATTAGLRVEADRRTLATLTVGALLGLLLGVGGIAATNAVATATVAPEAVAAVHPLFVPYALGVALLSTLVALPYPLALAFRTDALTEVDR